MLNLMLLVADDYVLQMRSFDAVDVAICIEFPISLFRFETFSWHLNYPSEDIGSPPIYAVTGAAGVVALLICATHP